MSTLLTIFIMCISAVGVFLGGVYWRQIILAYKRLQRKKKRNSIATRIEQLEMRVDLHTRKDKVYLDKFDELEGMIDNLVKASKTKEYNRDRKVKQIVIEYLKQLQNE